MRGRGLCGEAPHPSGLRPATFSRSLNRRLWHYRAKSLFRSPLPFANAFGVVPTGHPLVSSAWKGKGARRGMYLYWAFFAGAINESSAKRAGRPGADRRSLPCMPQPKGDSRKRAGGRCVTSGGLRCSPKHQKPAPDRVKRGRSMGAGRSPARRRPHANFPVDFFSTILYNGSQLHKKR